MKEVCTLQHDAACWTAAAFSCFKKKTHVTCSTHAVLTAAHHLGRRSVHGACNLCHACFVLLTSGNHLCSLPCHQEFSCGSARIIRLPAQGGGHKLCLAEKPLFLLRHGGFQSCNT